MKSLLSALVLVSAFASATAFAELLTLKPGTTSKNGVNISLGATANIEGKPELTTVGSGLRNKQVVFNIPVYIAQVMVSDAARYVKTDAGALTSLDNQKAVAVRLTFLRDVDAATVMTSFQDSFDANKISTKDADIANFLAAVSKGADAKNGASLTILMVKADDGSETVTYENGGNVATLQAGKDMTHKIMSIWLGASADNGLKTLKAELLK